MSNEEKTCQGCKYVLADTNKESAITYRCTNQESENFGKPIVKATSAGCDGCGYEFVPNVDDYGYNCDPREEEHEQRNSE